MESCLREIALATGAESAPCFKSTHRSPQMYKGASRPAAQGECSIYSGTVARFIELRKTAGGWRETLANSNGPKQSACRRKSGGRNSRRDSAAEARPSRYRSIGPGLVPNRCY